MKKAGVILLLAAHYCLIVSLWLWDQTHSAMGNQFTKDTPSLLLAVARLGGLLAFSGLMLQMLLIGRVKWIESLFGLDRLSRIHHTNAFITIVLVLVHPPLLTIANAQLANVSLVAQFIDFMKNWEDLWAAEAGQILLVVVVILSIALVRKRLKYEGWYYTHLAVYAAIGLVFMHQTTLGYDLVSNAFFKWYWIGIYAFVLANLVGFRLVSPLATFWRRRFYIERVEPETADVTSVYIKARSLAGYKIRAGQFMLVRFWQRGFRFQAHPFSMSCYPEGEHLRLSIKNVGDFTSKIPELTPGTRVIVDGPHGIFTAGRSTSGKVLMIAGGIGITPIRSVSEELARAGRDVLLLYSNRTPEGIVFREELDRLAAAHANFRVEHVITDDPAWPGERGMLDGEKLARLAPDVKERDVYLCGPPPMMDALRKALLGLGVEGRRIYWERFAL